MIKTKTNGTSAQQWPVVSGQWQVVSGPSSASRPESACAKSLSLGLDTHSEPNTTAHSANSPTRHSPPVTRHPLLAARHPSLAARHPSNGFTLIELLMVIIIIGILLALLLPAINSAMKTARKAAVSSEIAQLAQALANFKSKYGDYPPSRFLAVENGDYNSTLLGSTDPLTANNYDPTSIGYGDITLGQLAQRSVSALRKFWPRVNTATGAATNQLVYDFNGNGSPDGAYVLHGHECLVFFLGGVPSNDGAGNFGMTGFDKNPQNPFTNLATSSNRQPPLFEFNPGRLFLDPNSMSQIPGYYDSLNNASPVAGTPITLNFYAYFSAYGNSAYDPNDVNFSYEADAAANSPLGLGYCVNYPTVPIPILPPPPPYYEASVSPNPYTSTLTAGPLDGLSTLPTYQNAQSFQIISSGPDGLYGVGGQYVSNSTTSVGSQLPFDAKATYSGDPTTGLQGDTDSTVRQREGDNLTNFKSGSLQ